MTLMLSQLVSAWPVLTLLAVVFAATGIMAFMPGGDD